MVHQITQLLLVMITILASAGAIFLGFLAARKKIQRPILVHLRNGQDLSEFVDVGLAGLIANLIPQSKKLGFWVCVLFLEIFIGLIILFLGWAALYGVFISSDFSKITIFLFVGAQLLSFISIVVVVAGGISLFLSLKKRFTAKG